MRRRLWKLLGAVFWQRATLGVSQVGVDQPHVDSCLREVVRFIDDLQLAEVGEERVEFLHY